MPKVVAVEDSLNNVNQVLRGAGFETVGLDSDTAGVGAIVISGQEQNFLGMQDTQGKIPVISAAGRSADEVVQLVQARIM